MLLLNITHFKQQNHRVIEAIGPVDTYHPKIFCVTGSAKNATNLHYNMLFLSIINPLTATNPSKQYQIWNLEKWY